MDEDLEKFARWLRANGMLSGAACSLAQNTKDGNRTLVALYRGEMAFEPVRASTTSYLVMDRDDFPMAIRPTAEDAIATIAAHHRQHLRERPQAEHDRLHALGARYILPIRVDGP